MTTAEILESLRRAGLEPHSPVDDRLIDAVAALAKRAERIEQTLDGLCDRLAVAESDLRREASRAT